MEIRIKMPKKNKEGIIKSLLELGEIKIQEVWGIYEEIERIKNNKKIEKTAYKLHTGE